MSLILVVERFAPRVAVLEEPFHGVNSRSLIVLAQARGALLAALALRTIEIAELTPAEVKSAITGNGRADKQQVARMVAMLLPGARDLAADTSDALAVALGYASRRPLLQAAQRASAPFLSVKTPVFPDTDTSWMMSGSGSSLREPWNAMGMLR